MCRFAGRSGLAEDSIEPRGRVMRRLWAPIETPTTAQEPPRGNARHRRRPLSCPVTGGPEIDADRCRELVHRAKELHTMEPREDAVERYLSHHVAGGAA